MFAGYLYRKSASLSRVEHRAQSTRHRLISLCPVLCALCPKDAKSLKVFHRHVSNFIWTRQCLEASSRHRLNPPPLPIANLLWLLRQCISGRHQINWRKRRFLMICLCICFTNYCLLSHWRLLFCWRTVSCSDALGRFLPCEHTLLKLRGILILQIGRFVKEWLTFTGVENGKEKMENGFRTIHFLFSFFHFQ